MTTYDESAVSNTVIAHKKPITMQQGRALRDNLKSYMEGDPSITDANRQRVLLATISSTSGSTVSASGLTLTNYRSIIAVFDAVSLGITTGVQVAGIRCTSNLTSAANTFSGAVWIDLLTGIFSAAVGENTASGSAAFGGNTGYSSATTTIAFSSTTGNFDAGQILIYGCK